jgi:hypothetical protein
MKDITGIGHATSIRGESSPAPFLKKKIQIGSCAGGGAVNFNQKETVFHPDTITPERRALRRHSSWNYSTDPEEPICVRRSMENFAKDRCRIYYISILGQCLCFLCFLLYFYYFCCEQLMYTNITTAPRSYRPRR